MKLHLTKQEQAAILGHMTRSRAAMVSLSDTLRPAAHGGRIDVAKAQAAARRISSDNGHLLVWLNSIARSSDGTDLTAHL